VIPETIGNRIRRAREAAGYKTLRSFAEAIRRLGGPTVKTHEITVGAWEKDKQTPDSDHLELVARVTHTSVDWILRGDESAGPSLPSVLAEFFAREAPEAGAEARRWMIAAVEHLPPSRRADRRFLRLVWLAYEGLPDLPPSEGARAAVFTEGVRSEDD
jgi:transcriptional regulator with XRE-family HTH domain